MKNLITFQSIIRGTYGHDWQENELFNFWRAQIDNSLRFGWKPEDLIILTNLSFEYKNVNVFKSSQICSYNKYFNKILGIWEVLKFYNINDNIWFHDFDDWQISKFDFPDFPGSIGCCLFVNFTQICMSSLFIKPQSLPIWELVSEFIQNNPYENEMKQIGDDHLFNNFIVNDENIKKEISLLDASYNIGMTQLELRLQRSKDKPKVIAFKPTDQKSYNKIKQLNLIDTDLENIFKNNNLL
jgi:hypothetical protein